MHSKLEFCESGVCYCTCALGLLQCIAAHILFVFAEHLFFTSVVLMFPRREHSCHCYCGCNQSVPLGDVSADHKPGRQRPAGRRWSHALCCSVRHKPWMGGLHCMSALLNI